MSKRVLIDDFFQSAKKARGSKSAKPVVLKTETPVSSSVTSVTKSVPVEHGVATQVVPSDEVTVENGPGKNETGAEENNPPVPESNEKSFDPVAFARKYNFDKAAWIRGLSPEERDLLKTEINTLHISWLVFLHKELTKPYFLSLKRFLKTEMQSKTVFPSEKQIYSWSHLTPLPYVKCLIMGQDPYHNHNQAHGLAFSVLEPTKPPPSLANIYKTIAIDYPQFISPSPPGSRVSGGGNLTKWAQRGVLMLNACLTVEAHKANSHAKHGWEEFTEMVIKTAVDFHRNNGFVIMAWGSPAQKRIAKLKLDQFCVLRTVHPSPLSAHRGFFESGVFKKGNDWLEAREKKKIDWGLVEGNVVE